MHPFRSLLIASALLAVTAPAAGAVVAGTPASRADYPYFSVVGTGCGGALIGPDRVLTAAHCTEALQESNVVLVGPRNEKRTIRRRAMHPLHVKELAKIQREFPPPAADLMLLELNRPVTDVAVAQIATKDAGLLAVDTPAVTIGRGATASDGSGGGTFRRGTVAVQDPAECPEQLDNALTRTWSICTRDPAMAGPARKGPFVSACVGDSGGPLLAAKKLIGVVSWGPSCGEQRDPEIYANAVQGRDFALAKKVAWAPTAIGMPRVVGQARVGRTVRCAVRWLVPPTRKLSYGFAVDHFTKQTSARDTFRLTAAYRGKKVSCDASGETAGGRGGTLGLAPGRLVR